MCIAGLSSFCHARIGTGLRFRGTKLLSWVATNFVSLSLLLCVALSAGCSTLPTSQQTSSFGTAAASASNLLQKAVTAHYSNAELYSKFIQADIFLQKGNYRLIGASGPTFPRSQLQIRINAIKSLERYGKALASASSPATIKQLEDSALKLSSSVESFASLASPMSIPVLRPIIKATARVVGWTLGNAYAAEIQSIVTARNKDVQTLVVLLKSDLSDLKKVFADQYRLIDSTRRTLLNSIRDANDPRIDRLRMYHEFNSARNDVLSARVSGAVIANYEIVLDELAVAHDKLANRSPDAAFYVQRFVAITDNISDIAKAISESR